MNNRKSLFCLVAGSACSIVMAAAPARAEDNQNDNDPVDDYSVQANDSDHYISITCTNPSTGSVNPECTQPGPPDSCPDCANDNAFWTVYVGDGSPTSEAQVWTDSGEYFLTNTDEAWCLLQANCTDGSSPIAYHQYQCNGGSCNGFGGACPTNENGASDCVPSCTVHCQGGTITGNVYVEVGVSPPAGAP